MFSLLTQLTAAPFDVLHALEGLLISTLPRSVLYPPYDLNRFSVTSLQRETFVWIPRTHQPITTENANRTAAFNWLSLYRMKT
jgi:hypothetical protein